MVNPAEVATSQEPLSDEDVVARVLAGETGMFEIVMRRHNQRLYRVARAILRNDGEAAETSEACRMAEDRVADYLESAPSPTQLTTKAIQKLFAS